MRFDAFDLDLTQGGCDRYTASHGKQLGELGLALEFVHRGPAHHSGDGNERPNGRNHDGIAGLQMFDGLAYAIQQQIVKIHLADELLSAVVLDHTQRTGRGRSAGGVQRVQRRGKRADVVGSGALDISHNIDPDGMQARDGEVDMSVVILRRQCGLDFFLGLGQSEASYYDRPRFRQRDAAFAIDDPRNPLGNASPGVDGEVIARTQNVVGAGGHVHGEVAHADDIGTEDVSAEALEGLGLLRKLGVQVAGGRKTGIRVLLAYGLGIQGGIVIAGLGRLRA